MTYFKCKYCDEVFSNLEAHTYKEVIGHVWYTTIEYYKCPYCGNEDIEEYYPTEEEEEEDDEYQEE